MPDIHIPRKITTKEIRDSEIVRASILPRIKGQIMRSPYHKGHILDEYLPEAKAKTGVRKFAPVCPSRIYTGMREAGYIPDTILLLAHDVAKDKEHYEVEFNHDEWYNTTIIMDNSVVETGGAVDAEMVLLASKIVGADIVVLPDVLGKGELSRQETCRAWTDWFWEFRGFEKMIVIQGSDEKDWLLSAEEFVQFEPDWIAIPRVVETGDWERHRYIQYVKMLYPHSKCHLLGFSDFIQADIMAAQDPYVRSIDSAVPLRYTGQHLFTDDMGKRGDWWETAAFDPIMIDRCKQIDTYISRA